MVAENFRRDGNIREKYNVVTRSSEARAEMGYHMNVIGFGWTERYFWNSCTDFRRIWRPAWSRNKASHPRSEGVARALPARVLRCGGKNSGTLQAVPRVDGNFHPT